jgi:ankyrin repeat protein
LHWAAVSGFNELVEVLLAAGASINAADEMVLAAYFVVVLLT